MTKNIRKNEKNTVEVDNVKSLMNDKETQDSLLLIYEYIKHQYNSIYDNFKRNDTKISIVFAILGILSALTMGLFTHLIYIIENLKQISVLILIPALLFVLISFYEFIMIGKNCLDLLWFSIFIPGLKSNILKDVLKKPFINSKQTQTDFIYNYLNAYDKLLETYTIREKIQEKIIKRIRICSIYLVLSVLFIMGTRIYLSNAIYFDEIPRRCLLIMNHEDDKRPDKDTPQASSNEPNQTEKIETQPSMIFEPTEIKAGLSEDRIKKINKENKE